MHDTAAAHAEFVKECGSGAEQIALRETPLHLQAFPLGVRLLRVEEPVSVDVAKRVVLDLVPRPIMAAGAMVELLVSSSVGHYVDFRAFDASFLEFGGDDELQHVPASRADVFQSRFVSMVEKRLLMRFVKKCFDGDDTADGNAMGSSATDDGAMDNGVEGGVTKTFNEEMSSSGLTEKLQLFLKHAIAFTDSEGVSCGRSIGIESVRRYQASLMKYGTPTPFLYANHGSGELPQAFCRLCAVHGGVYVLRRGVSALIRGGEQTGERFTGVVTTENEIVRSRHVFASSELLRGLNGVQLASNGTQEGEKRVWRAIVLTDGCISNEGQNQRVLICVPRGLLRNTNSTVRIRQLDSSVRVCPTGLCVVYAETVESGGTEADVLSALGHYIDMDNTPEEPNEHECSESQSSDMANGASLTPPPKKAFQRPRMLWGATFERACATPVTHLSKDGWPVVPVFESGCEVDADAVIGEARRCFELTRPGVRFFAKSSSPVDTSSTDS